MSSIPAKHIQQSLRKWRKIVRTIENGTYKNNYAVGLCGYCEAQHGGTKYSPSCEDCVLHELKLCFYALSPKYSRWAYWRVRDSQDRATKLEAAYEILAAIDADARSGEA